jgi:hypothetical protein
MMRFLIVAIFVVCSIAARSQNKYVQKLYAFKEKTENSTANYFIYIELPANDTSIWQTAVINGAVYTVHASEVEAPLHLGERKRDQRMIVITPQMGNKLWKLDLDDTREKSTSSTEAEVVLKGTFKNHQLTSSIKSAVELVSP